MLRGYHRSRSGSGQYAHGMSVGSGLRSVAATRYVIAGELARALGLPVPEQVIVEVDPALGLAEPDPEHVLLERAGSTRHGCRR